MQLPDNMAQRVALADIYFAKYKEVAGDYPYDVISVHDIRGDIRNFHDEIESLTEQLKEETDEKEIKINQDLLDAYKRDLPKLEVFAAFVGNHEEGWVVFKAPAEVDVFEDPWWMDGIPVKYFSGEHGEPDAKEYAFFLFMLDAVSDHITINNQ